MTYAKVNNTDGKVTDHQYSFVFVSSYTALHLWHVLSTKVLLSAGVTVMLFYGFEERAGKTRKIIEAQSHHRHARQLSRLAALSVAQSRLAVVV